MSVASLRDDNQSTENLEQLAAPFQFDDANVIIRAGGVDFPAHRFILSRASPVFKDMFSLPSNPTATQESLPVIEVEEDAQTIHDILSLLYFSSNDDPVCDSLSDLQSILLAARKYSMDKIQARFARPLGVKAKEDPIRVFTLACKVDLPEVARAAAVQLLTWDFATLATCDIEEFARNRTQTLLKLLRYHRNCAEVGLGTITSLSKASHGYWEYQPSEYMSEFLSKRRYPNAGCPCPVDFHSHRYACDRANQSMDCRGWWYEYIERIQADCKSRPLGVGFRDLEFMKTCCRDVHACGTCSNALYHLIKTGEFLEEKVRSAIMKVKLELDDDDMSI
ncbi:hypothetical protein QCA50_004174 [Cerrena zonata]|uniref:BTB domain-containing protein n=1 Tax=Cerrena zonata TaxID=2478898 RepID=A0AAW0GSQ2_9APHY